MKFILALFLLPVCAGAVSTMAMVIQQSGRIETIWVPFAAGVACWVVIYILLPRPMWIYVVGHEFTHALWGWAFGARLKKFKATSKGGHVVLTKSNFLIALAPYFFPVYSTVVILVFVAGHLLFGWRRYQAFFHLCLGMTYAFHLALTAHVLQSRQSDVTDQGYFFSGVIIFLGNITVLLLGIPLLGGHTGVLTVLRWWLESTAQVVQRLAALV